MIRIDLKGKRIERAVKEYRQKISKIKLHKELRERKTFTKNSAKKRAQRNLAKYKNRKYGRSEF
jgi:ribosomal protein S21